MSGQQLLLSWKDHNGALVSVFENLLKRNTLVDCTLAAEGQYLKAHKVVLSACSAYFELLFSQESEKNPIVILKDVKFQELRAAVNFMYKGEVEVCEDRLAAFLEVADSLQIKGLGSNRRTDPKENVPARSANEKTFSPKPSSRKESATSNSDSAKESAVCDSEQSHGNESSSRRPLSHEASRQSPAQGGSSSFNIHSASSSGQKSMSEHDPQEGSESPPPSHFIPVVDVTCGDSPVIKTEQGVDSYSEDKSEGEGDYGDDVIMDDQDDWDEGKGDMGSESSNQPDIGYQTQMKSEEDASGSSVPSRGDPLESAGSLLWKFPIETYGNASGVFTNCEQAPTFDRMNLQICDVSSLASKSVMPAHVASTDERSFNASVAFTNSEQGSFLQRLLEMRDHIYNYEQAPTFDTMNLQICDVASVASGSAMPAHVASTDEQSGNASALFTKYKQGSALRKLLEIRDKFLTASASRPVMLACDASTDEQRGNASAVFTICEEGSILQKMELPKGDVASGASIAVVPALEASTDEQSGNASAFFTNYEQAPTIPSEDRTDFQICDMASVASRSVVPAQDVSSDEGSGNESAASTNCKQAPTLRSTKSQNCDVASADSRSGPAQKASPGEPRKRRCPFCKKYFSNMHTHIYTHTGEKQFVCSICTFTCNVQANLKRHIRLMHSGDTPFMCGLCSKRFKYKIQLQEHEKKKHKK